MVHTTSDVRKSEELQGATGGYGYTTKFPLADFAPGRYVLRLTATSLLGKPEPVTREIEFRVAGKMSGLTTIARGDASHVAEPRRAIARTEEEWRALWAVHAGPGAAPPAVDLAVHTVAAAFAGEKPSAGHSIEVTEAVTEADRARGITLAVEERGPGRDTVAAAIITSPFHIVAVPRTAGEVAWSEDRGSRIEDRGSRVGIGMCSSNADRSSILDPRSSIPDPRSSTGLEPRTAAALAYLAGPFSGALMLMAESANADVRFHAWQSIIGLGGLGLAVMASYVLAFVAMFVWTTGRGADGQRRLRDLDRARAGLGDLPVEGVVRRALEAPAGRRLRRAV